MKLLGSFFLVAALAVPVAAQRLMPAGGSALRGPEGAPDLAVLRRREGDDWALVLGLSAAQRPALDAFLAARMPGWPEGPPPVRGAAAPSFERELAEREARGAEEAARIAAARRFYAGLDARQQRVLDAVMRLRRGPGGPHGPHGRGPRDDRPGGERPD